jgi:hypothetical protein
MTYIIEQTKTTPSAEFKNGYLVIRGKSVPYEYPVIYDLIKDRLVIYSKLKLKKTQVDFYLSVVNAVSKRYIYNTFKFFEELEQNGTRMEVNWFYQTDNEDIKELGEICKSIFKINVQLKETI